MHERHFPKVTAFYRALWIPTPHRASRWAPDVMLTCVGPAGKNGYRRTCRPGDVVFVLRRAEGVPALETHEHAAMSTVECTTGPWAGLLAVVVGVLG